MSNSRFNVFVSKEFRQALIHDEPSSNPFLRKLAALIEVQRVVRGFVTRRRLRRRPSIGSKFSVITSRQRSPSPQIDIAALTHLQAQLRRTHAHAHLSYLVHHQRSFDVYNDAARLIQSAGRRHLLRNRLRFGLTGPRRYYDSRRRRMRFVNPRHEAASKIQRLWRSYVDRQVFSFYRALISFRERFGASEVLRGVNPREASLVADRASNSHIRFRLGGRSFPPMIYYRIFTHGPICDVGAFAPRDYTVYKQSHPLYLHTTHTAVGLPPTDSSPSTETEFEEEGLEGLSSTVNVVMGAIDPNDSRDRWYRRIENNPWRPIVTSSDLILSQVSNSEEQALFRGSSSSSSTTITGRGKFVLDRIRAARRKREEEEERFHFSRVVRQEQLAKRRDRKRLDWRKKMYRLAQQGIFITREEEEEQRRKKSLRRRRGRGRGRGMGDSIEIEEEEEEEETDELLNWCSDLDYEKYIEDWETMGLCADTPPLREAQILTQADDSYSAFPEAGGSAQSFRYGSDLSLIEDSKQGSSSAQQLRRLFAAETSDSSAASSSRRTAETFYPESSFLGNESMVDRMVDASMADNLTSIAVRTDMGTVPEGELQELDDEDDEFSRIVQGLDLDGEDL